MAGRIINISGVNPVEDPSYRYKMPSVFGKIEGRGNGIKTVIANITDLALALHRHPSEVNKFFGCEIGAQTTYNEADDKAIVNGAHGDPELQNCVHKYIEKFVLCPNCGLPETTYKISNGCIWHRCAACGAKEMVDMNHKLCTYILAQEKKMKKEKAKAAKKEGKDKPDGEKEKSEKKDKKKKKSKEKEKGSDDEKKKKKKKDKKKKKEKKDKGSDEDLAEGMDDLSVGSDAVDDQGATNLAIVGVQRFMKENPDASAGEVAEDVVNQQMASALKSHDKIHIFLRAVIASQDDFKNKAIENNAEIIGKITQKNPIMERHLISAAEGLCSGSILEPKYFPVMLKQLFDEDVLAEMVILEWAFDGRTEYTLDSVDEDMRSTLRAKAEPVVAWLQEDSDSDDSDSDSDSD